MAKEPLISVIIPVYNASKYLKRCYLGLQAQTYTNLELIFINDASTDDSLRILKEIQASDIRVKIIDKEKNEGVSAARNSGLDICTGEYIGFCDADDVCKPDMFSRLIHTAVSSDAELVCCALERLSEDGKQFSALFLCQSQTVWGPEEAMTLWLIGKHINNSVYSKLSRKELWDRVRFPVGEIFEEANAIPQLISRAKRIAHTGTAEYQYYCNPASLTSKPASAHFLPIFKRQQFVREFVLSGFPKLKDAVDCFDVRQNLGAMMGAEINYRHISPDVYDEIREHFNQTFWLGLGNRYVTLLDKAKLIYVKSKLFRWRKRKLIP